VPIDPYYLGLWLGDGVEANTGIVSADREHTIYLQAYTDRLNQDLPGGARPLKMKAVLTGKAGTKVEGTNYVRAVDCYTYHITSPNDNSVGYSTNPLRTALRDLGILGDKSKGIPQVYMDADEDTRLAVIAGLIESDGTYVKSHNTYRFTQTGESHKKIVHDLKALALSCGISVTGVDEELQSAPLVGAGGPKTMYIVYLGKGSIKFQHHLLIARKRMDINKTYYTHDARPFQVKNAPDSEYRAIEVSGGQFQLANRLVALNCHLVSTTTFLCVRTHHDREPRYRRAELEIS
jgi:glutamate synthase (NADPH/NADH)